ncbi:MAG: glycosyltransferase family 2 protein [Bacteroidota bacterium]|jgi:glycosyltransferase involved in cell wall biosynthesis
MTPFVSICIPAYKRLNYLQRLFDSIRIQTYKNYELVITDDSGIDSSVYDYVVSEVSDLSIVYHKNLVPLGSPKNWLASISHAKGDWIKIMHDDDYFTSPSSLQEFVDQIDSTVDCIFSGYHAVYENGGVKNMTISSYRFKQFVHQPLSLFSNNIIGPPSVMMFRKSVTEIFDERLKWIVDWEYYIRLASKYKLKYITKPLIEVSYNDSQITNSCFLNPAIEIPETLIFTNKYGNNLFKNILAYDAWWRLIRNLRMREVSEFIKYSSDITINDNILKIVGFQSYIPLTILKVGAVSKLLMSISYLFNRDR